MPFTLTAFKSPTCLLGLGEGWKRFERNLTPGQVLDRVVEEASLRVEEDFVIFSTSSKTFESGILHISKENLTTSTASIGMV